MTTPLLQRRLRLFTGDPILLHGDMATAARTKKKTVEAGQDGLPCETDPLRMEPRPPANTGERRRVASQRPPPAPPRDTMYYKTSPPEFASMLCLYFSRVLLLSPRLNLTKLK